MTDLLLSNIFRDLSFVTLVGLLIGSIFFFILGMKEIREQSYSGVLYVVIAIFFLCSHFFYLNNIPPDSMGAFDTSHMNTWRWLATLLAPSVVTLFLMLSLGSMVQTRFKLATIEIFFGLTLFCFLYMLGHNWPTDVQAAVTSLYLFAFFKVELTTEPV